MSLVAGQALFDAAGRIDIAQAGVLVAGSFPPRTTAGRIAVSMTDPIEFYAGGIPITTTGRIATMQGPMAVATFQPGAIPVSASGRLSVNFAQPIAGYVSGFPRTASGAFAVV